MKSKTDLYQLIKAMSKSEKRYFTLDAQKSGRKDARYLELFQVINDMEAYDEAPLKARFGKTLPTDKTYLYEAILRSMRDYRSANSYAARIKEMIMDAKYLYERGLYEQSEERLHAAKELAEELGDQLSAIDLNKEHRRLLKYTRQKGYEQKLEELILEKELQFKQINEELLYLDIYDQLSIEILKNRQALKEEQKEVLKLRFAPFFDNIKEAPKSVQNQLRLYQCLALFYQLLNDTEKIHHTYSKIIECWDASPKYKSEEFHRYIIDVSNLIHNLISNGNYSNQFNQLLLRLENERPANPHNQNVLFQRIISYRLLYSINTGDFAEVNQLVKRIEKGLKQFDISPKTEIGIIFNVSTLLFMAGQYELCQEWSQKLIQQRNLTINDSIQSPGRILHILATMETGKFEQTELYIRNTNRYLNKLSNKNNFIINTFNLIKKIHLGTPSQAKQAQKQLHEYILSIQNAKENVPLGMDELILYWLESKISKTSISQIVKAKLAKAAR